jgi:hypothetical protein
MHYQRCCCWCKRTKCFVNSSSMYFRIFVLSVDPIAILLSSVIVSSCRVLHGTLGSCIWCLSTLDVFFNVDVVVSLSSTCLRSCYLCGDRLQISLTSLFFILYRRACDLRLGLIVRGLQYSCCMLVKYCLVLSFMAPLEMRYLSSLDDVFFNVVHSSLAPTCSRSSTSFCVGRLQGLNSLRL